MSIIINEKFIFDIVFFCTTYIPCKKKTVAYVSKVGLGAYLTSDGVVKDMAVK